jgi:hypothetical protein
VGRLLLLERDIDETDESKVMEDEREARGDEETWGR